MITDVAINGTGTNAYMTFSVPNATIDEGNAVIAVLVNGVIAWSWHIWVTDEDLTTRPLLSLPQYYNYNNSSGHNPFTHSAFNLGAHILGKKKYPSRSFKIRAVQAGSNLCTDAKTVTQVEVIAYIGANPLYQWGRKDPLPADPNKTYYYSESQYNVSFEDNAVSFGTAIRNPTRRYCTVAAWYIHGYPSNGDSTGPYVNLWNNGEPAIFSRDDRYFKKTIYDPCPVGYRVAFIDRTYNWIPGDAIYQFCNGVLSFYRLEPAPENVYPWPDSNVSYNSWLWHSRNTGGRYFFPDMFTTNGNYSTAEPNSEAQARTFGVRPSMDPAM